MAITAIMGGGDWNDASVEFLILPDSACTIQAYHEEYKLFLQNLPNEMGARSRAYLTFGEWLLKHKGAVRPSPDQLTEFWEY